MTIQKLDDWYRLDRVLVWVDLLAFQAAVDRSQRLDAAEPLLEFAHALYKGELCDGSYFDWATLYRERLRGQFIGVLQHLASWQEERGETEAALTRLDQALEVDPYDEELCRRAMKLGWRIGRRDLVIRRFRRLRRLLLSDLGIEPSVETKRAFEQLAGNNPSYPLGD